MDSQFPIESTQMFKTPLLNTDTPVDSSLLGLQVENIFVDMTQPFFDPTSNSSILNDESLLNSTQAFIPNETNVKNVQPNENILATQIFNTEESESNAQILSPETHENSNDSSDPFGKIPNETLLDDVNLSRSVHNDETANIDNNEKSVTFEIEKQFDKIHDNVDEIQLNKEVHDQEEDFDTVEDENPSHSGATVSKNRIVLSSDDEDEQEKVSKARSIFDDDQEKQNVENEEENSEKRSEVGELIADIFGESDDEETRNMLPDEEENPEEGAETSNLQQQGAYDDEDFLGDDDLMPRQEIEVENEFISDFDLIMARRKAQTKRHRSRRRDFEFINNNDDLILDLLKQMEIAAKEDIELNLAKQPATRKRTLLKTVITELKKADLVSAFIENGVIKNMADWLSMLPDKSLPTLEIRTDFLKLLLTFPTLDHQILRSSNIGKSVMLLLKHPKENKENKERARKLINEWARPIFNLQTDYRSLSKDERMKRDYDNMPVAKKRRLSSELEPQRRNSTTTDEKSLGPGDKGFVGRARVPQPSTRDYVMRPKWNVETEFRNPKSKKQTTSEMDRKIREIKMRTATKKSSHAVPVSVEGRRMAI